MFLNPAKKEILMWPLLLITELRNLIKIEIYITKLHSYNCGSTEDVITVSHLGEGI